MTDPKPAENHDKPLRFFIAGIMQGSHSEAKLHDQSYREEVKKLIATHFPTGIVYDPLAAHDGSLNYDDATGRKVFFMHNEMCREIDVLLAFVPQASMGTAVEMWEAYTHGAAVITVSPLEINWAVRFLSHAIYPDWEAFVKAAEAGELERIIAEVRARS